MPARWSETASPMVPTASIPQPETAVKLDADSMVLRI